jgi:hypothetical protein
MKRQPALHWLVPLVGILALVACGLGLFWQDGGRPFSFTTLHGQSVQMYGQGIYHFDTFFKAPILRGTDAVVLFLVLPLLGVAFVLYRRGSLKGGLLLISALAFMLYVAASTALGAAYNSLILVYLGWFSSSLFAFILALTSIDPRDLAARLSPDLPRRGIAAFLFVTGLSVFVWLVDIIGGLAQGQVPAGLASYTTDVTGVLDLGIIAPTAFLAGVLVLRRAPWGYLLAAMLLIVNAIVGIMVVAQTVSQILAGITLSTGEFVGKVISFVAMGAMATYLAMRFLRSIAEGTPSQPQEAR